MKRIHRNAILQTLIFVCLLVLYCFLQFPIEKPRPILKDYEPKVPVNMGSILEQRVRADLSKQSSSHSKIKISHLMDNDENLRTFGFNVELSNTLFYIRKLPDARSGKCKKQRYNLKKKPVTASVIIVFHNVPLSMILRTVHSVVKRSSKALLRDIILIDDASSLTQSREQLEYYVRTRFSNIVQIERNRKRLGMAQSRLRGSQRANGEILIFMDAYCEPNAGWLEPLLSRIQESPTSVVMPTLDQINATDFSYKKRINTIGGFNWKGDFLWLPLSKKRRQQIKLNCTQSLSTCPISSPTIPPGSVYAIARIQFQQWSYFDESVVSSGGDTLDMSFSIWLCGGQIEVLPCSRVGRVVLDHRFDFDRYKYLPKFSEEDRGNVAVSWWEKYQNIFFKYYPKLNPDMFREVKARRHTIQDFLNCKSFNWYLKRVYPDKYLPKRFQEPIGRLKSGANKQCLTDKFMENPSTNSSIQIAKCKRKFDPTQIFFFSNSSQLRTEFNCLVVNQQSADPKLVELVPCDDIAKKYLRTWTMRGSSISMQVNHRTMCLDQIKQRKISATVPALMPCNKSSRTQYWIISAPKMIVKSRSRSRTSIKSKQMIKLTAKTGLKTQTKRKKKRHRKTWSKDKNQQKILAPESVKANVTITTKSQKQIKENIL
ncbi:polypeptide N-acetylgalactosaminyltransferase 1-like [Scaptodrosophila lebanonensis]|uniref:Polypeptide N-acetylgalactosaminyltransferase n=1 Tax=Drosophila lebanonensis TaxID=7225 RepID=A0A6J2U7X3_DROLE|nr:polypeptide N-acetylgalactosaminyltransferase 1-like [Scaptodrosophila lebanonensis]